MSNTRRAQGAGSVYLRKDGRYAAAAVYEDKRITKYGKTKKEAWENLQAALDDLKAGRVVTGPKQTVKQYLEHWLENVHRLSIRLSSLLKYRDALKNHILPALGHLQLTKLTREHIQAFYTRKIDEGLAPRTVRQMHNVLNGALSDAVRDKLLSHNVCDYVTLPRLVPYDAHVLTQEECQKLIDAAMGTRLWPIVLLAVTTGLRRGEVLSLRWEDVNLSAGTLLVHRTVNHLPGASYVENETKTRNGRRSVRLPAVVLDALNRQKVYIEQLRAKAGLKWEDLNLVFPNRNGSYMSPGELRRVYHKTLDLAGLPRIRFHDLRHSAATLLFAVGVNPKVVQELLGHSHISVTLGMYGHVTPNMQKEVVDKMNDMFGKQP